MDEWGFNPASVEAVATASAVFAVIFAWLSLRESKEQRRAVEDEIGSRMRPWIGFFAFEFSESEDRKRILRIQLRNFGALPAQKARLSLVICPKVPLQEEEAFDAITRQEPEHKVLMPGEEGNYPIDLSLSPELSEWIGAAREVLVKGSFEYALGGRDFNSEFEATIWFSRAPTVDTNWRNILSS